MKPRVRSIKNLYFRYGQHIGLEAEDVAIALQEAGCITRIGPALYSETQQPKLTDDAYRRLIENILNSYMKRITKES